MALRFLTRRSEERLFLLSVLTAGEVAAAAGVTRSAVYQTAGLARRLGYHVVYLPRVSPGARYDLLPALAKSSNLAEFCRLAGCSRRMAFYYLARLRLAYGLVDNLALFDLAARLYG